MIDGQNSFNQPIRNDLIKYDNIRKIAAGQGDDCVNGCLLDYNYFKNYCKMIALDLGKQQALDADPKAVEQINFTGIYNSKQQYFLLLKKLKKQF